MDKIFDRNIIEQDSILCKIQSEVLLIISKLLTPTDVVHLSRTCKELHQKLPFYLIKSGDFIFAPSNNLDSPTTWFEGRAVNFFVNEINISIADSPRGIHIVYFLIQVVRDGIVVIETDRMLLCQLDSGKFIKNFTKEHIVLKEHKPGDTLRFLAGVRKGCKYPIQNVKISLQLENYRYDKPLYVANGEKGYANFKGPSVIVGFPGSEDYLFSLMIQFGSSKQGNRYFMLLTLKIFSK